MHLHRIRATAMLATAIAALCVAPVAAQTADVSGTWHLEVTTDQGVTTPSFTIQQDGSDLTGHYSSEALGEIDFTGTVEGSRVTISFDADLQGQTIPLVYEGTVADDGTMSGTIDIAGGALTGTFTAVRADG